VNKSHYHRTVPIWPECRVRLPDAVGPAYSVAVMDDPPALLSVRKPQPAPGAKLPDEWVLRGLRTLDLGDPATYVSLWETYGPLVDLSRRLPDGLFPNSVWSDQPPLGLQRHFGDETSQRKAQETLQKLGRSTEREPIPWHVDAVSFKLLRHHFELLRALSEHLYADQQNQPVMHAWKSVALNNPPTTTDAAWALWEQVLRGAIEPISVTVGTRTPEDAPPFYSIAALDVFNVYADGLPIRNCANDYCPNRFERQLGEGEVGSDRRYRTRGVIYCSPECADAQRQREKRRKRQQGERP
jgi:hypothetical protein